MERERKNNVRGNSFITVETSETERPCRFVCVTKRVSQFVKSGGLQTGVLDVNLVQLIGLLQNIIMIHNRQSLL